MVELDRIEAGPLASEEYQGAPGRTRQSTIHYSCMSCGFLFTARVHVVVNVATDPTLGESTARGDLNVLSCPSCGAAAHPSVSLVYHDPGRRRLLLVIPDALRHQELELRVTLLKELASDEAHVPEYVRSAQVVFGMSGLQGALLADERAAAMRAETEREQAQRRELDDRRRAELERREEELVAREEDLSAREEDLLAGQSALNAQRHDLERALADLGREREALRALALDLEARERKIRQRKAAAPPPLPVPASPPPPPPPAARPQDEVDRWRASDARSGLLLHQGRVCLLARPGAELLAALEGVEPTLLVQQRSLGGGALIALAVRPGAELTTLPPGMPPVPGVERPVAARRPPADQAVFWCLDPTRTEDRERLQRLAEELRVQLDLYDDEARLVKTWDLRAPLEENLRWALGRCPATPPPDHDFGELCRTFDALGEERLGRKQHNFSADSFVDVASASSARLALGIVGYWSQPENEDYLIGVKSFALPVWRAIRERVVRQAMDWGIRLGPELTGQALELKLTDSKEALLKGLLASFAEVSLRIKPSDLDPAQEAENWKLLLADCVQAAVRVDKEIEDLAAASARRAGGEDEAAPGGDLGLLPTEALVPLLERRDQRRDAALELCDRREVKALEPLFAAVCSMTRAEVARVLPAMVAFGQPAVPFLIQGLKHRKSFIRQGSALALGAVKARGAVEPLIEMVLGEPTTVWKEAARALGDVGSSALAALLGAARTADVGGRERLAWAMAHAALATPEGTELRTVAQRGDPALARVAGRALALLDEVRQGDQEVRGARPLREQTIVRSFSRQFFAGVAPAVDELGEGDIVEQEEELDDHDIVDEEVEVGDEDILDR